MKNNDIVMFSRHDKYYLGKIMLISEDEALVCYSLGGIYQGKPRSEFGIGFKTLKLGELLLVKEGEHERD